MLIAIAEKTRNAGDEDMMAMIDLHCSSMGAISTDYARRSQTLHQPNQR